MDRVGIGFLLLLGCAGGWWAWGHYKAPSEAVAGVERALVVAFIY